MPAGKSTRDQMMTVHIKVGQSSTVRVKCVQHIHAHRIPKIKIIMINKITPSLHFGRKIIVRTNQLRFNKRTYPKFVSKRIKERVYKTLGTSIIYFPD